MWLRRAFFVWLIPSAFLLPLWLLIGWGVFNAQALGLIWVLLIAIPSVFIGQLIFTLLVRARGTVRASRAVSWGDVLAFTVWHGLTVALGFFNPVSWVWLFLTAIVAGLGLFWYLIWALVRESRPQLRGAAGHAHTPDVVVITERGTTSR